MADPLLWIIVTLMIAITIAVVFLSSSASASASTTTLFLRVGGQLTTDAPSMAVVTHDENAAVKDLHLRTPFFHSDHAHTDYVARSGGGASWSTPPLATTCKLRKARIKTSLWIGTNAKSTDFTASLSRWSKGGGWASLCGATASTLSRKVETTALPGKGMIAVMANGGYSVELQIEMQLADTVEVRAGDVLRLDVTGGQDQAPTDDERVPQTSGVVHRVWHSPKWASAVELSVEAASPLELKFSPGPKIAQPTP